MLALLLLTPAFATDGRVTGTVSAAVAKNLANTIVYVKAGDKGPTNTKTVTMDQVGLMFTPRVLPIQVGWTVSFTNSDTVGHSVFSSDVDAYDLGTWPSGESRTHAFTKPGVYRQLCKVHDDMIAYIVVLDTARFGMSDKAGAFAVEGLPAGDYTLAVWNEKLGSPDIPVHVDAGKTTTVSVALGAK